MADLRLHQLTTPLAAPGSKPDAKLPGSGFIGLVGTFDHVTTVPYTGTKPDDNHAYVWVKVPSGPFAGRYEAAVNVHSDQASDAGRDLLYATREIVLDPENWPEFGATAQAAVSYAGLELTDADFATVEEGALRSLVLQYASTCARLTVYGIEYVEHTGLHDIHLNPGRKNADGALVFYFDADHGGPAARWLFLKFAGEKIAL